MTTTKQPTPNMSNVYSFNFKTGKMESITAAGLLPVGQVVTYSDMANAQKEYVVTSADFDGYGQACICEDGHASQVSKSAIEGPGGWELSRKRGILTADEIAAFVAQAGSRKVREDAEHAEAKRISENCRSNRRAEAIRSNPHLEQVKPGSYASAALGAKNIRKELKKAFPGQKFSVTSSTFSGGDSIDVRWTLGPTMKEVEAITGKYQEGHFDGMADIYETDRENVWPDIFGGAKYVSESRDDGEGLEVVAAGLCKLWDLPLPPDGKSFWNIRRKDDLGGHDVGVHARQIVLSISYPVGAAVTGVENCDEREDVEGSSWARYYRPVFTAPGLPAKAPDPVAAILAPAPAIPEPYCPR